MQAIYKNILNFLKKKLIKKNVNKIKIYLK